MFISTGGKNFFANYELKRHIAHTHNQSKEYKCEQCDKAYGYSHLLKRHISEVHEEINVKHPCDKCDKVLIFISSVIANASCYESQIKFGFWKTENNKKVGLHELPNSWNYVIFFS